ncbi:hypothetical protein EsH8_I_001466 [Colletotrichum jinshuiense]
MADRWTASYEVDTIIIGIDFGTTFSGVSWAYSGQPDDIEVISRWESKMGLSSDRDKVPSAIIYQSKKRGNISWGYAIPPSANQKPMKWFKLLLVDEPDLPKHVRDSKQIATARKLVKDANKDPVEVISSYLRHLWNHSIECITTSAGKELVKKCRFHVVITLPTIWPDYAKVRMRRAAENAGLLQKRSARETTLAFISEPEAAALATMRDFSKKSTARAGDHLVVCDAGGGTVDLISYEVLSLKPFVVREAVEGDGDLCGGVFLDEAFVKLIKKKVTPQAWDNIPMEDAARLLNYEWENCIKQSFNAQDEDWHINLPPECRAPGSAPRGVKRKRNLALDREDLLSVFDPTIDKTVALVRRQIAAVMVKSGRKPKQIILVGGFGRCVYLRSRLQDAIGTGIEIIQGQGTKPWTAICRGAVIHGLTQRNLAPDLAVGIKSRISRMSYGTKFSSVFDPKIHDITNRYWDDEEQAWKASNQMEWFLEKGTDVSTAHPVRKTYYQLFESAIGDLSEAIYSTAAWPAPGSGSKDVHQLCAITWTKEIDFESLPRFTNPLGKVYAKLNFDIEMTCSGGSIDFTVIHDGKQVGAKNVCVSFKSE